MQGLEHWPDDIWLKHRAMMSLASAGAASQAVQKFTEFFGQDDRSETEISSVNLATGQMTLESGSDTELWTPSAPATGAPSRWSDRQRLK
jgi:hypothetical protein